MILDKSELLKRIDQGWTELRTFIDCLTEEQMTIPTDAAGWTVKDHLINLAMWEDTVDALLSGQPCWERIGIDASLWRSDDVEEINAVIQRREKARPLADVLTMLYTIHNRVVAQVQALPDEDLQKSTTGVQRASWIGRTYLDWIIWSTYEHYIEHMPWMEHIAHPNRNA